jgi:flagellar basal-body rod protein FlgB
VKLFEKTKIPFLESALSAYSLRNKVIATNVANINTAGYKAKAVSFEEQLTSALSSVGGGGSVTNEGHIPLSGPGFGPGSPRIVDEPSGPEDLPSGVNNVDVDHEMTELAMNQIRFRFAARLMSETFKQIEKSIRGQA